MKLTTAVEVSERLGDDVKFWLLRFTLRCFTSSVNAYEAIFFLYSLCSNRFICSSYILSSTSKNMWNVCRSYSIQKPQPFASPTISGRVPHLACVPQFAHPWFKRFWTKRCKNASNCVFPISEPVSDQVSIKKAFDVSDDVPKASNKDYYLPFAYSGTLFQMMYYFLCNVLKLPTTRCFFSLCINLKFWVESKSGKL